MSSQHPRVGVLALQQRLQLPRFQIEHQPRIGDAAYLIR